jgi:hypothetical protein
MARPKKVVEESVQKESTEKEFESIEAVDPSTNEVEVIKVSAPPSKEEAKAKIKKLIEEETKLVEGKFRNFETPGGSTRIQIRKYPNIPMFDRVMIDGERYKIPLYAARHLNGVDRSAEGSGKKINTCSFPVHGFNWDPSKPMPRSTEDAQGIPVPLIGIEKWTRRYGFESLEFDIG